MLIDYSCFFVSSVAQQVQATLAFTRVWPSRYLFFLRSHFPPHGYAAVVPSMFG